MSVTGVTANARVRKITAKRVSFVTRATESSAHVMGALASCPVSATTTPASRVYGSLASSVCDHRVR